MNAHLTKMALRALVLLAVAAGAAGCGGGDDCDAGTGTFKPLPKECAEQQQEQPKATK